MLVREEGLELRVDGGIAHLVIDSPPRNDLSFAFFDSLAWIRREVLGDLDVEGMILSGRGRHFSSGASVSELLSLFDARGDRNERMLVENVENLEALEGRPYPVVAAVSGCCFGAGLELAMACHYLIASSTAVFALPETGFGLMPGCGGTLRLQERVGRAKAIELVLTGRTMLADEARDSGLVDMVVDRKDLMGASETAVRRLGRRRGLEGAG